ncbi:MAG: hypothetical protein FD169_208 [Bacillota bacterium]|nr:MAG: hypothetical protein FD169_208 [Bacillota bacterium]MBS3950203.1 hypothetical protein [Peptococcaceae bacterium]
MRETDLFPPVAEYLLQLGFTVRSEVRGCDITAVKDNELVIVELKTSFSIDLLIQATTRQRAADTVYVAIPRPAKGLKGKHWQGVVHLVKRLELGLLLLSFTGSKARVEVAVDPSSFTRKSGGQSRKAILSEIAGRSQDYNQGGSTRQKLMTAYRENAIQIACLLNDLGPLTTRKLRDLGTGSKTQAILYRDHYKWFRRVATGTYDLTELGRQELERYPELVEMCRRTIQLP